MRDRPLCNSAIRGFHDCLRQPFAAKVLACGTADLEARNAIDRLDRRQDRDRFDARLFRPHIGNAPLPVRAIYVDA